MSFRREKFIEFGGPDAAMAARAATSSLSAPQPQHADDYLTKRDFYCLFNKAWLLIYRGNYT